MTETVPAAPEKPKDKNQFLFEEFLNYLSVEKGLAQNTLDAYRRDLAHYDNFLKKEKIPYTELTYSELPKITAELIAQGNIIGWLQGRLEFGPRALGARSIIADARNPQMQSKLNLKIKYRESFRPFAPTVLKERVSDWFELDMESPYMLLVAPVKEDKRVKIDNQEVSLTGLAKLKLARSLIPAVTHVDYSARIQTVEKNDQPLYYALVNAFYEKTECPVIINTSFNVRGEPLVCTPEEAFRCFMRTEMDYLVMGKFLLNKRGQELSGKNTGWQKEFVLD